MSKYEPLGKYLREKNENHITMTFDQIEHVLGFELSNTLKERPQGWYGTADASDTHVWKKIWYDAGYKVETVDFVDKKVRFIKHGEERKRAGRMDFFIKPAPREVARLLDHNNSNFAIYDADGELIGGVGYNWDERKPGYGCMQMHLNARYRKKYIDREWHYMKNGNKYVEKKDIDAAIEVDGVCVYNANLHERNSQSTIFTATKPKLEKVVFVNLTEMMKYDGDEPGDSLPGGTDFVVEHGYGHELFNFRVDDGKYYGYFPKGGTCDIWRIAKNAGEEVKKDDQNRHYIDGVLVIFTASRKTASGTRRVIVGHYNATTVYAKPMKRETLSRYIAKAGTYAECNSICDAENGFLLAYDDRKQETPLSTEKDGDGHGWSAMWYADGAKEQETRQKLIDYVRRIAKEIHEFQRTADERKYSGTFGEGGRKRVTATIDVIKRSAAARQACLEHFGCKCQICGFKFEDRYGELGKDFIEVHHIDDLAQRTDYADTDPEKDLIPVCSNCHRMLHRKRPAYKPDEIKSSLI